MKHEEYEDIGYVMNDPEFKPKFVSLDTDTYTKDGLSSDIQARSMQEA